MASKRVVFHEAAVDESRFAAELELAITLISKAPQRWPVSVHGTRKLLLKRFPFAVIYRELASSMQVLAVAHTRRRPYYWKDRL